MGEAGGGYQYPDSEDEAIWPWGECKCRAHGIGHAPADPTCGFSAPVDLPDSPGRWRGREWRHVPLCTDCMHGGCDANRPLPPRGGSGG